MMLGEVKVFGTISSGKGSSKKMFFFRNISLTGGPPPPLALPFFTVSPSSLCGGIIDFY